MPETVNGYELFQMCLGRDPAESISFAELENDLGDGYDSGILFGANTGLRRWKVSYPILAGAPAQANISINGMTLTEEAYLWDLFCRSKVNRAPFVVESPRNGQYYFAKFADKELTYTRMITKLYSTGIELVQRRISGVSVFDVNKLDPWGWYKADAIPGVADGDPDFEWDDASGNGNTLYHGSQATYQTNEQNGLPIVRLDGVDDVLVPNASPTIYEAFFLMKMRAATFGNYGGILTANANIAALTGDSGTTKFYNHAFGAANYAYHKNSLPYAEGDQQAPMNVFGLVHGRWKNGVALANLQIGKDRNFAGRFAAVDLGEIVLCNTLRPFSDALELSEYLLTKWNIS